MADKKKQYGLIMKKKEETVRTLRPMSSVFGDDELEETEKVDVSYTKSSASTIRTSKQAERQHEAALAADPTIFDYDAAYDEIEAEKNEKIAEQKVKDKERSSKYIENFMKAHKRRELEKQSREERQQQKERIKEGDEFADKEVFVTGAYKEQMVMVQKLREEEAYEAHFNQLTAVDKQKIWQSGLQRQLLEDIARTGDPIKKKERNIRKRLESNGSDKEEEEDKPKAKESTSKADSNKKSIYSDDEEAPAFEPPKKNFEGELKPGLNRVIKKTSEKAETKAERLRNRMFTPSPERGEPEDRRRDRRRSPEERKEPEPEKPDVKPVIKKKISPEEIKAKRMAKLREILKQRNGPEEIETFRQRYLERKASGIVQPPL